MIQMTTKAKHTTRRLLKKEVKYLISRVKELDAVALAEFVIKSVDAECLGSFCEVYLSLFWPASYFIHSHILHCLLR